MEQRFDLNCFVRILNSEIIYLKKVKRFDLCLTGTICITFFNRTVTYVPRQLVVKIKHILGVYGDYYE